MKKISVLVLIVILMMGVSGCMNSNVSEHDVPSLDEAQDIVLRHLNKKYGKNFEIVASEGSGIAREFYTYLVVEQNRIYEDSGFKAFYYYDEQKFLDGFFGIIIRDEIANYIKKIIEDDAQVFVAYNSSVFDEELVGKQDLNDNVEISFIAYIFTNNSLDRYNELFESWDFDGMTGRVLAYSTVKSIDDLTYENYEELVSDIIKGKIATNEQLNLEVK